MYINVNTMKLLLSRFDDSFKNMLNEINERVGPIFVLRLAGLAIALAVIISLLTQPLEILLIEFALGIFWGYEYAYALQSTDDDKENE